MAILNSQGNLWTVDPTSKAARATLYDSAGCKLQQATPTGSYLLPINFRQGTQPSGGRNVWFMHNIPDAQSSVTTWVVRRMFAGMLFDGTTTGATTATYGITQFFCQQRISTGLAPIAKRTSYGEPSDISLPSFQSLPLKIDADQNESGITFPTTATFTWPVVDIGLPQSVTGKRRLYDIELDWRLLPNEGICIRTVDPAASIQIGTGLTGFVEFDVLGT